MDNRTIQNNTEFEGRIESKRVYIYGCGVYGRTLFFFTKEQAVSEALGFVVTKKEQGEEVLAARIYSLDDYAAFADNECILVIGVSERYRDDVIRNVKDKGIENVLSLSDDYWNYILSSTSFLGTKPDKNIAILMYHRIDDNVDDFWKLNVSKGVFEKHISYISRNYEVLRLDDDWSKEVNSEKKYVVITFDDGYANNYTDALPILEEYHVPATFFVSTDLIDTNDMFWWDELEELLVTSGYVGSLLFEGEEHFVKDNDGRKRLCWEIRNHLKEMAPHAIKEEMDSIRAQIGNGRNAAGRLRCLSIEELRLMSESEYVTIGGHTKSHLSMGEGMLHELTEEEVRDSLVVLRSITGRDITTFAYPFGGDDDRCQLAEEVLKENGIKKAVIVKPGNIGSCCNMYELPRHMMFNDDDIERKLNRIWGIYG